jgi:dihydroorotate dehydrogenase (fumarate)/dihydropyrimidine dehydrogenase (NAD+) subunit PreA
MERQPCALTALSAGEAGTYYVDDKYVEFISKVKKLAKNRDVKVIASIGAASEEGWDELCQYVNSSEADMVELNFGCPFAGVAPAGAMPEAAERFTRICRKRLSLPVIPKLNPQCTNSVLVAKACERAGADGIVAFNSGLLGLRIDIESGIPLGQTFAGLTGAHILPYTLGCIASMRMAGVKISISASLGVWDWDDVIRSVMAGADAVQPCRSIMLKGYGEIGRWLDGLTNWMKRKGYEDLKELKGMSLEHILSFEESRARAEVPVAIGGKSSKLAIVDAEKCRRHLQSYECGWCETSCFHFAIRVDEYARINEKRCEVCGLCESICPIGAIKIAERVIN